MFPCFFSSIQSYSDNKVYEANLEPIWGRQDPGGPQVGPMNVAIWDTLAAAIRGELL